jgi:hypothetical protein
LSLGFRSSLPILPTAQPSNAANCATELLFQRFQHAPYHDAPHLNMTLRESVLRKVGSVFVAWAG